MTGQKYDFIIIGGGTSGSIIASRLSEDASSRVLLIEAGHDTPDGGTPPEILSGTQPWLPLMAGERFMWPGFTIWRAAPHPDIDRQPQFYGQGHILGGGSSVNMTVANRGTPRDYDEWEALGATGWGWRDVLPYFRKVEHDAFDGVDASGELLHGKEGPIPITRIDPSQWSPFTRSITRALDDLGLPFLPDQNGNFENGYFSPTANVEKGERVSAARGYLSSEVRARRNLDILTDTRVLHLLFDGKRAIGAEILRTNGSRDVVHGRAFVLTAGALQTPALLLRAGIGPAAELRALGIAVLADRPGVGQNLWDHASLGVAAPLSRQALDALSAGEGSAFNGLGIRASSGIGERESDLFIHLGANAETQSLSGVLWVNKPTSNGALRLRDTNPLSYPEVDFNLLSDPADIRRLTAAWTLIDDIFRHPALTDFSVHPAAAHFSDPQVQGPLLRDLLADEQALEHWVRSHVSGVWHASGTARIGLAEDPHAVVSPSGQVYGVEGLFVADASVMPTVPAANTNLPTAMIAEKLAVAIAATQSATAA